MKKPVLLTILFLSLIFNCVNAQTSSTANTPRFGIGANFAFPLGTFGDKANYGYGFSLLYQHPVANKLNITGDVGYLRVKGKEILANIKYNEGFIPIKAGIRYFLAENIYAGGELGVSISTTDGNGSGTSFVYVPGAGIEFPIGGHSTVDLGARYESWSRSNATRSFIGIRAGINF